MRPIFLAVAILCSLTSIAGETPQADIPLTQRELTKEQVVADLIFLRDQWSPKDHSFTDQTRGELHRFIDAQIAAARPMKQVELALLFERATALTGNNHSRSGFFNEVGSHHVLPFSFWWFPEGAMITRAHPQHTELLGARIVSIGGMPVEKALERVRPYIPGTEDTVLYLSPRWLRRIEVLQHLGLSEGESVAVGLVLANGKHVKRRLTSPPQPAEADRYPDPAQFARTWYASIVPGRGPNPWPHVLDHVPSLPLYARKPSGLTATAIEGGNVLYVRSNAIQPLGDEGQLEDLGYDIIDTAVKSKVRPRHAIVDVRFNEGGNFMSIITFAQELAQLTAPDGRIYVITSRATNSAAIVLAALLKGHAPERTLFVGEHPSDRARFYSEGADMTSPSGIAIHYADGLHDWGAGCNDLDRCYWPGVFHGVAIGDLQPDIPVQMTYAQFSEGQDPLLDAALADLAKRHQATTPNALTSTATPASSAGN